MDVRMLSREQPCIIDGSPEHGCCGNTAWSGVPGATMNASNPSLGPTGSRPAPGVRRPGSQPSDEVKAYVAMQSRFVAVLMTKKALGLTFDQFWQDCLDWGTKSGLNVPGEAEWIIKERAAEAFADPTKFAYDPQTAPQVCLTTMRMYGEPVPHHAYLKAVAGFVESQGGPRP